MSLLGLPMYKLNLWCMIVPTLGSHGRHNHTPQVQFTHMRLRKDMQNMLYISARPRKIKFLGPIKYTFHEISDCVSVNHPPIGTSLMSVQWNVCPWQMAIGHALMQVH